MIEAAQANASKSKYQDVEYHVCDFIKLPKLGEFGIFHFLKQIFIKHNKWRTEDAITAFAALHYIPTRSELLESCIRIKQNLAPGGKFMAFVQDKDVPDKENLFKNILLFYFIIISMINKRSCSKLHELGFYYQFTDERNEGDKITLTITLNNMAITYLYLLFVLIITFD